ncbi:MAG: class I mannose-6-phosphate isomerase [Fimbriimonadaceae bacterium]|nr:class I mannose-6-phosphate isomerase [Fimbriimonadaceae bacterium]
MAGYYPLLCDPHPEGRIWGGRQLVERYGKRDLGQPLGESWEVADLAGGQSRIANGPLAGQTLGAVLAAWGPALAGTAWAGGPFPLLVKLLDAAQDLSVQVHPSDADCAAHFPAHQGKDESWVVLAAGPGAGVIHGVLPGTTWATLATSLQTDRVFDHLRRVPVQAGEVLRVAPGTIHALLAGVVVLEVQQPSDSTFRLYDYGRGRPLHLAEAAMVCRLADQDPPLTVPQRTTLDAGWHETLVDVPAYRIERLALDRPLSWRIDPRSAQIVTALDAPVRVELGDQATLVAAGQTVLLPAAGERVAVTPSRPATIVVAGLRGGRLVEAN